MATFTKTRIKDISSKINALLVSEGFAPKINSSWSAMQDKITITLNETTDSGEDQATLDYRYYQPMFGLPDALGKRIVMNGKTLVITGYLRSKKKNNIRLEDPQGKSFMCTVKALQFAWGSN